MPCLCLAIDSPPFSSSYSLPFLRALGHTTRQVMSSWELRRLGRIISAWRALLVSRAQAEVGSRERRGLERLTLSLNALAGERWQLQQKRVAFMRFRAVADATRAKVAAASRPVALAGSSHSHRAHKRGSGHHHHHHHHHRHHAHRNPQLPLSLLQQHEQPMAQDAAALVVHARAFDNRSEDALATATVTAITAPVAAAAAAAAASVIEQQQSYLSYLKLCLRQGRPPAEEVVEMGRSLSTGGMVDPASTLSLQVRPPVTQHMRMHPGAMGKSSACARMHMSCAHAQCTWLMDAHMACVGANRRRAARPRRDSRSSDGGTRNCRRNGWCQRGE